MRVEPGKKGYYAGSGKVYRIRVLGGMQNERGVVTGWKVIGDGLGGLPVVSRYDLYDDEEAAKKAAFVKKLKGLD